MLLRDSHKRQTNAQNECGRVDSQLDNGQHGYEKEALSAIMQNKDAEW
jgi:hypothetical protein